MNKPHNNLSVVTDNINDYIVVIDKDYNVSFANEAASTFFNCSCNNIIGQKCYHITLDSPFPCHKRDSSFDCLYDEVFRSAESRSVTHTFSHSDGMQSTYEISASPIKNRDGEVLQVIEVIRDITSRREAEKALFDHQSFLSSVLEGIGDGVVVLNRNFEILSANNGYLDQVGKTIDEAIGKYCYNLAHSLNKPCYLAGEDCAVNRSFLTGKQEIAIHKHEGNGSGPIYVETKAYPLKDSSGNVTQVIEVINNITEKYHLEEELKRRVLELEEFYDMAVERELRMVELKKGIEVLEEKLDKSAT